MAKSNIITAIDVGSSKVATVVSSLSDQDIDNGKQINIIGVSSIESKGIKKGQIVDLEETIDCVVESVEGAERMAGCNLDNAYFSIGGAHINSQNSHGVVAVSDPGGEIREEDVDRVIEAASAISLPTSREILHVVPKEFIVDGEEGVRDPVGMSGVRLEVETHIISSSSAALKNLRKVADEVGIKPDQFIFGGLAATESVLTKTEKELGCVLIDIGGGTTSVAVFVEGALTNSFVIPIGSRNVTNDLAIGLRVSLESAEKIKVYLSDLAQKENESAKKEDSLDLTSIGLTEIKKISRKTLTEGIMRPRLNEIFTMIKIQLDKQDLVGSVPAGVIVTGGGALMAGIKDSAKRMISLPVRVGKPRGLNGLIDDITTPEYSVVTGLISYALKQEVRSTEGSFSNISRKIKLPSKGMFGKIISSIKEILP